VLARASDHAASLGDDAGRNASLPRQAPAPAVARRPGWRRYVQMVPLAIVLWGLDAVDKFRAGAQAAGMLHAVTIDRISDRIGGTTAIAMDRWLAIHPLLAGAATAYYIVLQVLVTGIIGFLLLRSGIASFPLHRDALIITGMIGLATFWIYPVAPPRMLPGYHDIAAATVPFFSSMLESKAAGEFASFPSLHVTWALWAAVAASAMLRRRLWRILVWAYPLLTTLDVLATANHYILDAIVAPAVLLLGYGAAATLPVLARRAKLTGVVSRLARPAKRDEAVGHRLGDLALDPVKLSLAGPVTERDPLQRRTQLPCLSARHAMRGGQSR